MLTPPLWSLFSSYQTNSNHRLCCSNLSEYFPAPSLWTFPSLAFARKEDDRRSSQVCTGNRHGIDPQQVRSSSAAYPLGLCCFSREGAQVVRIFQSLAAGATSVNAFTTQETPFGLQGRTKQLGRRRKFRLKLCILAGTIYTRVISFHPAALALAALASKTFSGNPPPPQKKITSLPNSSSPLVFIKSTGAC